MTLRSLPELIRRFQHVITTTTTAKQTRIWAHCLLSRYQGEDWREMIARRGVPFVLYEDTHHPERTIALELFHWPISPHVFPIRLLSRSNYAFRLLEGEMAVSTKCKRTGVFRAHPYHIQHEATHTSSLWIEGKVDESTTVLTFRHSR